MGDKKKTASGRSFVPKTAAARKRELAKLARHGERMQRELAETKKRKAAVAAAVRADEKKVADRLDGTLGRMLRSMIEEMRARAKAGDGGARQELEHWMGQLDRAVTDPAGREMAGLPVRDDRGQPPAGRAAQPATAGPVAAEAEQAAVKEEPKPVEIWKENGEVRAKTPGWKEAFATGIRALGGDWAGSKGYWYAAEKHYDAVVALARRCYPKVVELEHHPPAG